MVTYTLRKIFLSESRLKRHDNSDEWKSIDSAIMTNYSQEVQTETLFVSVAVELKFRNKEDKIVLDTFVQMVGVFEPSEKNTFSVEDFATINAPAIIYPFVREHANNLTSKSEFPFLLPPVNFVELAKKNKIKSENQS
jgi:preprotein translocase subunit SecB